MLQNFSVNEPAETLGRKPYNKPLIIHEFELETRAGSPLKVDPLDPASWDPFGS